MVRRKGLKVNVPAGTTLCPNCEGTGCTMCGGKGYYDAHKDKQTPVMPRRPAGACPACRSTAWWYREPRMLFGVIYSPGEWLCGVCHPDPNKEGGADGRQ